jgi:hypothetical protein
LISDQASSAAAKARPDSTPGPDTSPVIAAGRRAVMKLTERGSVTGV